MTEFGKYLCQCPDALRNKSTAMGLLKDALHNDLPKFRVLQAAYELGIIESLRKSNPITQEDRLRIITGLSSQYAMTESAAKNAISYWQNSITPEILKKVDARQPEMTVDSEIEWNSSDSPRSQATFIPENRPSIVVISQENNRCGIRIQWKRKPGIQGYEVWRAEENGQPKLVKSGTFALPRYVDYDVNEGVLYTYAIRGIIGSNKNEYTPSSNDMQIVSPSKVAVFQIREIKMISDGIQLSWSYSQDADYYVVEKFDEFEDNWFPLVQLSAGTTQFVDETESAAQINRYRIAYHSKKGVIVKTTAIDVNL